MAVIANLAVRLTAETGQFAAGMKRARSNLTGFAAGLGRFAAGAGLAAAGGLAAITRSQLATADTTAKLASRLGTTTEFLSEMAFVAERSGVSVTGMNTGLQRMTRRISEAAAGNKGLTASLKELGLDGTALNALSLEEQFLAVTGALAGVENSSDRVRLAFKLFDTEGVGILQTLENGTAGMAAMRAEAQSLGVTISSETAGNAAAFADAMTNLQAALSGVANTLILQMGPALTNFLQLLTEKIPAIVEIVSSLFGLITTGIGTTGAVLASLFQGNFADAFSIGKEGLQGLGTEFEGVLKGFGELFGKEQVSEQKTTNEVLRSIDGRLSGAFVATAQ